MEIKHYCGLCGGKRIEGSMLCAKCLILQGKEQAKMIKNMNKEIEWWTEMHNQDVLEIEKLIEHGFQRNRLVDRLYCRIQTMSDKYEEGGKKII